MDATEMHDERRANVTVDCLVCGRTIEVMLGVPYQANGHLRAFTTAVNDHVRQSPHCSRKRFLPRSVKASAEDYAQLKPQLPGVPQLMPYPPQE